MTVASPVYPFSGCGIAGVLAINHENHGPVDKLKRASELMAHRGPDGAGVYTDGPVGLVHRRLAVLDLSRRGAQPMTRGPLTIVHNGEIYNFHEIRNSLKQAGYWFTTGTDTEVILRAYEHWGPECLHRFNGMFAFAIWNSETSRLFLARDRLGIKPIYYSISEKQFAFASEVRALLELTNLRLRLDMTTASRLLVLGFLGFRPDRTVVDGIESLHPGTYLEIAPESTTRVTKYWSLSAIDRMRDRKSDLAEELHALLSDSVRLRLISDVPIAFFASGGLDSSMIAVLASRMATTDLTAITTAYVGENGPPDVTHPSGDLHFSRVLMREFPDIAHKIESMDTAEVSLTDLDRIVDLAVFPDDSRLIPIDRNYQCVADQSLKVVLNGQGADELMGGYFALGTPQTIQEITGGTRRWVTDRIDALPYRKEVAACADAMIEHICPNGDDLNSGLQATHLLLTRTILSRILQFEDFLSMQSGVECRLPYLDHRIVEWAFSFPFEQHIDTTSGQGKRLLRECGKTALPTEVWRRPKQPFPQPDHAKLMHALTGIWRDRREEILDCATIQALFVVESLEDARIESSVELLFQLLGLWRWDNALPKSKVQ